MREASDRARRRKKFFHEPENAQELILTESDTCTFNYCDILDHLVTEMKERFEHLHSNISYIMSAEVLLQIETRAWYHDDDVDASTTANEFKDLQKLNGSYIQPSMNKKEFLPSRA